MAKHDEEEHFVDLAIPRSRFVWGETLCEMSPSGSDDDQKPCTHKATWIIRLMANVDQAGRERLAADMAVREDPDKEYAAQQYLKMIDEGVAVCICHLAMYMTFYFQEDVQGQLLHTIGALDHYLISDADRVIWRPLEEEITKGPCRDRAETYVQRLEEAKMTAIVRRMFTKTMGKAMLAAMRDSTPSEPDPGLPSEKEIRRALFDGDTLAELGFDGTLN